MNKNYPGGLHVSIRSATINVRLGDSEKKILNNISLDINPGDFVCIIGLSGSGKTSFIRALIGQYELTTGEIQIGSSRIPEDTERMRGHIGYMQQDDINHLSLSTGRAFKYAADLRLGRQHKQEKESRIDTVLSEVGISNLRDTDISKLSGGESKRASIAIQLLSKPGLLLLDEATSSLDGANESRIMKLLANQAEQGMTVACVTHHLDNIDLANKILILHHGSTVWFGSLSEAMEHFQVTRIPDIYQILDEDNKNKWADKWREKSKKTEYPTQGSQGQYTDKPQNVNSRLIATTSTLIKRSLEVFFKDKLSMLLSFLLTTAMAILMVGAYHDARFHVPVLLTRAFDTEEKSILTEVWGNVSQAVSAETVSDLPPDITAQIRTILDDYPDLLNKLRSESAALIVKDVLIDRVKVAPLREIIDPALTYKYLFNITTIVSLMGFVFGIKEHVKERHIFLNETLHGVPIVSYLASKLAYISLVMLFQVSIMTIILSYGFRISEYYGGQTPEPIFRAGATVEYLLNWLLATACGLIGFLSSILVRNVEQAFIVLPILQVSQILLGGGVIPVKGGLIKITSMIFSPAYWSFRGIRSEADGVPENWHFLGDYDTSIYIPFAALTSQIITTIWLCFIFLRREARRMG